MEKFSDRESFLLGFGSPQTSPFGSSVEPNKDADIDFTDVFGGPPRRQSFHLHGTRNSFSERATDSHAPGREGSTLISRRPLWPVRNEKPVFGDEATSRRRFTTDDFFNDIFRGNESACNSPRKKNEFDSFGSNPVSRVWSPTQPFPPKAEPFGTSVPSPFSLPSRLNRDTASNGLSYYSYSPLSRSSNRANSIQDQEDPSINDGGDTDGGNTREGLISSEASRKSRNFHFSIYKWRNKGVPVTMPLGRLSSLRFKGKGKVEVVAEELLPSQILDDLHCDRSNNITSVNAELCKSEPDKEENIQNTTGQKTKTSSPSDNCLSEKPVNETPVDMLEAQKPKLKPLGLFFIDKDDEQDSQVCKTEKKPDRTKISTDGGKPAGSSFVVSSSNLGEIGKNNKVKGKVKEFVEMFNHGASTRTDVESLGQSSRFKTRVPTKAESKVDTDNIRTERSSQDVPVMEQKSSRLPEKQDSVKQNASGASGCVSGQEDRQEHSRGITQEDTNESCHVNFQVKELSEDETKPWQTGKDAEEIQAKIRKWSTGKEGNIRSLLSTLQYILWPESGWQQVPLIDMIEGNAVRRSYQKALLILHPDKLQQKGASSNQKYIAEKVFELLQEAWKHFNSLGPFEH